MKIHILSDLHNEFSAYTPALLDADVVVLAGDIDVKSRGVAWAREAFPGRVLYVPGNHEFYRGHMSTTLEKMRLASDDRVQVLDRDQVLIGNVRFLGATSWTDFSATGNQPLAVMAAQQRMNDFRQIRTDNYRPIRAADIIQQALLTRAWLRDRLNEDHDGPTVVITHHAPLLESLRGNPHSGTHVDAAYANNWEDLLGGDQVSLWLHGHSHVATDYSAGGTRVVCNPRGYPGEQTGFNPGLLIEL